MDENRDEIWECSTDLQSNFHALLENLVGEQVHLLWFSGSNLFRSAPGEYVLCVANAMYEIWILENYSGQLEDTLRKIDSHFKNVSIAVKEMDEEESSRKANKPTEQEPKIIPNQKPPTSEENFDALLSRGKESGLNEVYTFENYVSGPHSEIALAAAKAVAVSPGKQYQPLFFNAASGLGKSHLLHAIGWESLRLRPKSKIIYSSAETFANDYIDAIQRNSLHAFRAKYREADLLLLDDVQFLGRKEGLQTEFFHTFNSLSDKHHQIVLACDSPASEISDLEDRLMTRFQWGLSATISAPDGPTCEAILRKKRDSWNLVVSDETIHTIADLVHGNVRLLEGALIRVSMAQSLSEVALSSTEIQELLNDLIQTESVRQIKIETINDAVASYYDLDVKDLSGKRRTAKIAHARQMAMALSRQLTDNSLVEISRAFARDHGTVVYAIKSVQNKIETDPTIQKAHSILTRKLEQRNTISSSDREPMPSRTNDLTPS